MPHPRIRAILILVSFLATLILLSEAISAVPKVPIRDLGIFNIPGQSGTGGNEPDSPSNTTTGPSINVLCPGINYDPNNDGRVIMEILGHTNTDYLRTETAELYNGTWTTLYEEGRFYTGGVEKTQFLNINPETVSFSVHPVVSILGYIPCTIDTYSLGVGSLLTYYPNARTWYSYLAISNEYRVEAYVNTRDIDRLRTDRLQPKNDYLGVPPRLQNQLHTLAREITAGEPTIVDQLLSIETYLKTHYTYDLNYTKPPVDVDPVDWFLFTEKRGICGNFNSAFVLLARSIGLPARLVVGYAINDSSEAQQVTAGQAHAWAEVPFRNAGWVTFDATARNIAAPIQGTKTSITTITEQPSSAIKGHSFLVNGIVTDEAGSAVTGMRVNLYIEPYKNFPGMFCGSNTTNASGQFSINCTLPYSTPVGSYFIEARSIGNTDYEGSFSDPPITVQADTIIQLDLPKKTLLGQSIPISGKLYESVTNQSITNALCQITVTNGIDSFSFRATTNFEGGILQQYKPNSPGNWTVTVEFKGLDNWLGTSTTKVVRVLGLEITTNPLPVIVRGEPANLEGRVHAEDLPGAYATVNVSGGGLDTNVSTNKDGYFSIPYDTSIDSELGPVTFRLSTNKGVNLATILIGGISSTVTVFTDPIQQVASTGVDINTRICAKTYLTVLEHNSTYWRTPFTIRSVLLDDHSTPISGANITMTTNQGPTFSGLTSDTGSITFTGNLKSQPTGSSLAYNVTFSGRDYLLPSYSAGQMSFMTEYGIGELTPYVIAATVTCGAIYYAYLRKKNDQTKTSARPLQADINAQKTVREEKTGLLSRVESNENMEVKLPQLAPGASYHWGVNEPLEVDTRVNSANGAFEGDVIEITSKGVSQTQIITLGVAQATVTFPEKGYQILKIRHQTPTSMSEVTIGILIVDYGEEVTQAFNRSLPTIGSGSGDGVETRTAREVLGLCLQAPRTTDVDSLKTMFDLFEEATYSSHKISRSQYEAFNAAKTRCIGGD